MSLANIQLISPVYTNNIVKVDHAPLLGLVELSPLGLLRIPVLCPHCLKPGDIQESIFAGTLKTIIGIFQYTTQINIPFSTHSQCISGWSRRNISGSVNVSIEGNTRVRFQFREPLYAAVFTSINFPLLLDSSNNKLSNRINSFLTRAQRQRKRGKVQTTCPSCQNEIPSTPDESSPTSCPSCGFNLLAPQPSAPQTDISDQNADLSRPVMYITCPQCGIAMTLSPNLSSCGRCGYNLGGM